MPAAVVPKDVDFQHAPFPAKKCRVVVPAHFNATAAFVVCVFLHGRTVEGTPFENHIVAASAQMDDTETNAVLVAPRFDATVEPGAFADPTAFSKFIAELEQVLPSLLPTTVADNAKAAIGRYAANWAPLAIVAYSGGWQPLNAIVKGLLSAAGSAMGCTDRVVALQLLDSIYGPTSSSGPFDWQQKKGSQSALLSIYGRKTGDNAKVSNLALIEKLKPMGLVTALTDATKLTALAAGAVTFLEVETPHLDLPRQGPPKSPIAAFLTLIEDRLAAFASV